MNNKYSFLFVNIGGDLESIAQRVKSEGYPIFFCKTKGQSKGKEDTGIGIFTKEEMVDDYSEVLWNFKDKKKELIIVVDDNGQGYTFDLLRFEGWTIIGGTIFGDTIENERSKGSELMKKMGLELPEIRVFNKLEDGIKFVERQKDDIRLVFKPEGNEFAGTSKTYTSKNRQDLLDYMKWLQADMPIHHYQIEKFQLQEFIEGLEADFEAMFSPNGFLPGSTAVDIEEKKSGDGNKGEAIGCAGNIEFWVNKSKFFDEYIAKLTPLLKAKHYVGPISFNCIFPKDGKPRALEITSRFGWDATLTQMELLQASGKKISDWLLAIAFGTKFDFPHNLVGCGVRVYTGSISLKKDDVSGRYFSFDKSIENHLWFYSVSKKGGAYVIEDNPVLVVNAVAPTLNQSIKDCYDTLKKVFIPDIYYRTEIGKRAEEVMKGLISFGWL
jgi:phosphoribosylamine--glycine ligase